MTRKGSGRPHGVGDVTGGLEMPRRTANDSRTMVLIVIATLLLAASAAAALTIETDTGLRVTIHSAAEITDRWLEESNGRTWLRHPVAGEVELDTSVHPWADLTPVDLDVVAEAVAATHGFRIDLEVEIFLLPGFPANVFSSFARRESVFMAPGFAAQAPQTVAYVATHELGHVLTWAALDGRPDRWRAYRDLRELASQAEAADIPHAERHREIIAEDVRYLFGGFLATASGTIENPRLPLPDSVEGLTDLLAGYLAAPGGRQIGSSPSRVYPNPCRSQALVELDLGDAAEKTTITPTVLEIYDIRGRLIRRLEDGRLAGGRAAVTWDGNGRDGRRAAAGTYLYRIRHGRQSGSGRLILLAG